MLYITVAAILFAIYLLFILPTQWVKLERVRHPLGLGKKFFHISDLHVEKLRVSPERIKSIILQEQPDYILLTGDYTQKLRHLAKVDRYVQAINETQIPTYAVLGNHDYRLKTHLPQLLYLFRKHGIPVLRNESISLGDFRLVGIDDDDSGKSNPAAAFQKVRHDTTSIIITHDPNVTLKIKRQYDYLLCGHFHGGQFKLPFLFYFKQKGPLPKQGIFQGLHRDNNGTFYISKGVGQAGLNARFLMRSELTVHEL